MLSAASESLTIAKYLQVAILMIAAEKVETSRNNTEISTEMVSQINYWNKLA